MQSIRSKYSRRDVMYCIRFDQIGQQDDQQGNKSTRHSRRRLGEELSIKATDSGAPKQSSGRRFKVLICATLLINIFILVAWNVISASSFSKLPTGTSEFFNSKPWNDAKRGKEQSESTALFDESDQEISNGTTDPSYCQSKHNMTIITAYLNIGDFPKGFFGGKRTQTNYVDWIRSFVSVANPVMFFTDDQKIKAQFDKLRSPQRRAYMCSRSYLIQRADLWPFRSVDNISLALRSRQYFPSPPVTSHPLYVAATYSKYSITESALLMNPFKTPHFAWLDVGMYRDMPKSDLQNYYVLDPLPDLPPNQVGYLQIFGKPDSNAADFFLMHHDWIAGGAFFGRSKTMLKLTREFNRFARYFMQQQLIGSDQQVLGAMYGAMDNGATGIGYPNVEIKLYNPSGSVAPDPWFFLAYRTRRRIA